MEVHLKTENTATIWSSIWSEKALQIVEEWREVKSKGERESYIQLNTEFQKIVRRDKKAFSEQCFINIRKQQNGKD